MAQSDGRKPASTKPSAKAAPGKVTFDVRQLPFGMAENRGLLGRQPYPGPTIPSTQQRFGFLFPDLVAIPENKLPVDAAGQMEPEIVLALEQLGGEMIDRNPADAARDNTTIPSAYTYLGQFVDHDLTLDLTSVISQINDPAALNNFRDPAFNLDSVFGAGPGVEAFLYQNASPAKFIRRRGGLDPRNTDFLFDLQRNLENIAIIPDPRNDENLIVAQMHVAVQRFHNAIVAQSTLPPNSQFAASARSTVLHYQWILLHDFLPRLVDQALIDGLIDGSVQAIYDTSNGVFMPVEFSAAAYRIGHTMVRETYNFNNSFNPATLQQLFSFTKVIVPDNWAINWPRLLEANAPAPHNFARKFDPFIVPALHAIPVQGGTASLPRLNLQRGYALGLPTGQAVAGRLGVPVLSPAEISVGFPGTAFTDFPILRERTPLWYYILQEANLTQDGDRLGAVGQRIVAEIFIGILKADPASILSLPSWRPSMPAATPSDFTLADLITSALTEG